MFEGKRVLIIDDDVILCRSMELLFSKVGADAILAMDGREGLQKFFQHRPDLVILDITMPDINGWEVCRQIRIMSNVPVIMLTTITQESAVIRGLDTGADDFVSKPFSSDVLLARARAVLRREQFAKPENTSPNFADDHLVVDLLKRRVTVRGAVVKLSAREFDLLTLFLQNAGIVLTYQQILEHVWGWEYRDSIDYVHVYVSQLRRKLEDDPRNPRYIRTEHGVGYCFEKA